MIATTITNPITMTTKTTTIITTVTRITTNRIEGEKPPGLMLPPMGILETVPCVKDAPCITWDLALSSLVMLAEKKDIMQINAQKQTTGPHESTLRDKLASVHFKISTLETTPEDIQIATSYMKDLLKHTS
ncbi:hypothetical protein Tco_1548561 [Tanacetum coccineum]